MHEGFGGDTLPSTSELVQLVQLRRVFETSINFLPDVTVSSLIDGDFYYHGHERTHYQISYIVLYKYFKRYGSWLLQSLKFVMWIQFLPLLEENISTASQEIPPERRTRTFFTFSQHMLWVGILRRLSSLILSETTSLISIFILFCHLNLSLQNCNFPSGFHIKISYESLSSAMPLSSHHSSINVPLFYLCAMFRRPSA